MVYRSQADIFPNQKCVQKPKTSENVCSVSSLKTDFWADCPDKIRKSNSNENVPSSNFLKLILLFSQPDGQQTAINNLSGRNYFTHNSGFGRAYETVQKRRQIQNLHSSISYQV